MNHGLSSRLEQVREEIRSALKKSNRSEDSLELIAVSKTYPAEDIQTLFDLGQTSFGENRPQELVSKAELLKNNNICWHMIGHLQRNKIKSLLPYVSKIHSVDSLRLAVAISDEALKIGKKIPVLVEVNIAEEESKFGFSLKDTEDAVRSMALLPGICVTGLMTVAPFVEDPEMNRPVFRALHDLMVDINQKNIDNISMCELSMGMSNDYLVAIEEGATMVRVGSAIFGQRDYSK